MTSRGMCKNLLFRFGSCESLKTMTIFDQIERSLAALADFFVWLLFYGQLI